mgnify:CR=1 FL=1
MITLEEFKKKHSDKCRLIGLDLGSKRIGISICDEKQLIATPFKTINRNSLDELINELKEIINDNNMFFNQQNSYNGSFQYTTSRDRSWIHTDSWNNWAAVLYLTPNAPESSGTGLYKTLVKLSGCTDELFHTILRYIF